jgi:hypothetical protein
MDIFTGIVLAAATFVAISQAFGSGADDPNWELRWMSLCPEDRLRISTAARSGEESTDPGEAELVAGLRRRDRRRDGYVELALLPLPLTAVILSLTGVLGGGVATMTVACFTIVASLSAYLRKRFMDGSPRPAASPDAAL